MGTQSRVRCAAMSNPLRAMLQYEEKLKRELRAKDKWAHRYGTEPPKECPDLMSASVSICVLGHPLNEDGTCSDILRRRLERAYENWRLSRNSTVMILCDVDASMFPGAAAATPEMKRVLTEEFDVPDEQLFVRPSGLTTMEQSHDVSKLLSGPPKSPIGVIKLITSDFNIVRARRCFGYSMKIYVSDEEVPSALGHEDMMFMLDEEHRINHQYRVDGLYDATCRP